MPTVLLVYVVLAVRCYGGFEERLEEKDDDQESLIEVSYILERWRRRRGRRCD
jgi:hypothetical protein